MKQNAILGVALAGLLASVSPSQAGQSLAVTQSGNCQFTLAVQTAQRIHVYNRIMNCTRIRALNTRTARSLEAKMARNGNALWGNSQTAGDSASITQSGTQNSAVVVQSGSGDFFAASQSGDRNGLYGIQLGSQLAATTMQSGADNLMLVIQSSLRHH